MYCNEDLAKLFTSTDPTSIPCSLVSFPFFTLHNTHKAVEWRLGSYTGALRNFVAPP